MKCSSDLESVIATGGLEQRPSRRKDLAGETQAFTDLTRAMTSPLTFFDQLVKSALQLSGAGSTGISLLDENRKQFVWPAVAGQLRSYLGSGTPSDFGPCGTVIDRRSSILFIHPERHFTYLAPILPPLEEVLLIPFYIDGKPVGTIWAVSHDPARQFCPEDRQLLESLSRFPAIGYRALPKSGILRTMLAMPAC
ncbi:MAG: multi-sensor hybrid histidine kinase [Verrucomicrobiales bacterium]|nr:multi-sensor hybrid histidine kinase [Verrucomicrobiales bacterium]